MSRHAPLRALAAAMSLGALVLSGCVVAPRPCVAPGAPPVPHAEYAPVRWTDLPGWNADAQQSVWRAFLADCARIGRRAPWIAPCTAAQATHPASAAQVRAFFERDFDPYAVSRRTGDQSDGYGLITGYFEPLLHGARSRSARFGMPLYAPPPDLLSVDLGSLYPQLAGKRIRGRLIGHTVVPYYSRADLHLDPFVKGSAIVWVDDPLGAFFLEVQGSGKVELPDGKVIRLHYADENGYPYRSIGRYLVSRGELQAGQATMLGIRLWARSHPAQVTALLDADPSVVFFREVPLGDPALGPPGSLGLPLTPGRSIAVDPADIPLGAPVFLATTDPDSGAPLQRLVLAEDTGGAIRGPIRADLFWGAGAHAARAAGDMRQAGRLWLLWPKGAPLP
ncbi:MAG: murein transglycosylase A [Steroidobacteraceae bacterium]